MTQPPRPDNELCTEAEVSSLVHTFYAKVRQDEVLGPIFDAQVADWDHHLARLVDFWSSILRRTGRFSGSPMAKHAEMPGLSAELFQRWLMIFRQNAAEQPNAAMGEQACLMAERIAQSLWMGYQINQYPDCLPGMLGRG
jgi:hemoglobin